MQSCCFGYKIYCFWTFSSPSASLDLKGPNNILSSKRQVLWMLSGITSSDVSCNSPYYNATNITEKLSETLANVNELIERKRCTDPLCKFTCLYFFFSRCAQLAIRRQGHAAQSKIQLKCYHKHLLFQKVLPFPGCPFYFVPHTENFFGQQSVAAVFIIATDFLVRDAAVSWFI